MGGIHARRVNRVQPLCIVVVSETSILPVRRSSDFQGRLVLSEIYCELEIQGTDAAKLNEFMSKLIEALLSAGWVRDQIRESQVNRNLATTSLDATAVTFHTLSRSGRPAMHLGLMRTNFGYRISNITPEKVSADRLTKREYNLIVEEFRAICEPIANALGLEVHTAPDKLKFCD